MASFTLQLDSPSTVSFEGKFLDFSSTTTAIFLVQDKYVQQQEEHGASWTLAANGAHAVTLVSPDLTNIADFVKVIGYGASNPGSATATTSMLEIIGPNGSAAIALEGSGRLTVADLVKSNSLVLPPH